MHELIEIAKWLVEFLLLPLVIIYLYDLFNFVRCFNNLCCEIEENYHKMQNSQIDEQFTRMRNSLNKNIDNLCQNEWIGFAKVISIWTLAEKNDIQGNDYYRYLSNNELKNFIRQGYYRYVKENEENLTLFYLDCDNFSIKEQNIEKTIWNHFRSDPLFSESSDRNHQYLNDKINEINNFVTVYQSSIIPRYTAIHPSFKKGVLFAMKHYFSENFMIKKMKGVLMNFKEISFYQTWIVPNKWVVVNFGVIAFFFMSIWASVQWANADPNNDIWWKTIALTISYCGFGLSFAALPFVIVYQLGNQGMKIGVRFAFIISMFFLLMVSSYGIIEYCFPNAPSYMIQATTALISSIVGGFVALVLNDFFKIRPTN